MSLRVEINVTGARGGSNAFNELATLIQYKIIPENLKSHAQKANDDQRKVVPIRTGRLRNSISYTINGQLELNIFANAPYARFVEFGTYRMRARPFFYPAINFWIKTKLPTAIKNDIGVTWRQLASKNAKL